MKGKVSVIIPAFNVEQYILKALRSVADQTYQNWEIIVVDDCSTDGTLKVISQSGIPVILIKNDKNYGPSYSRNVAINHAKGEWIAVLDGDDWWSPDRLEKMITFGEENGADLIGDDNYWIVEGADAPYTTYFHAQKIPYREPALIQIHEFIQYDLGPLKPIIKKEFILKHHIFYNENIIYGEDFLFLLECLLAGGRLFIYPEPLYYRLTRDRSLTGEKIHCTEQLIALTHMLISMFTEGKYKGHHERPIILEQLKNRLKRQQEALVYNQFVSPFKRGELWKGIKNSSSLFVEKPYLAKIIASKIPKIFDYGVSKYLKPKNNI